MWHARLDESQAGIKVVGTNINNLRYADDTTLKAGSEEELKRLLMRVKEKSEKAGLKLNTQKTGIMASGPIISWQVNGGKQWKQWQIFSFWASKLLQMVTVAMKLKDACFLKESYDKPRQHIKKQRHHFADKGPYIQSYGLFSSHVQMWELDCKEGWVPKNWCFQIVVLKKILESPLDSKKIKSSVLKEINHGYSLEELMLKLKIQYFGHLIQEPIHWKRPWYWERLKAKGEEGNSGWDG